MSVCCCWWELLINAWLAYKSFICLMTCSTRRRTSSPARKKVRCYPAGIGSPVTALTISTCPTCPESRATPSASKIREQLATSTASFRFYFTRPSFARPSCRFPYAYELKYSGRVGIDAIQLRGSRPTIVPFGIPEVVFGDEPEWRTRSGHWVPQWGVRLEGRTAHGAARYTGGHANHFRYDRKSAICNWVWASGQIPVQRSHSKIQELPDL